VITLAQRPEFETTAIVQLIEGSELTEALVGVWRGAEDGVGRVFLTSDDWPMLPCVARQLAEELIKAAERVERLP